MELPDVLEVTQHDIDRARSARRSPDHLVITECVLAQTLLRVTGEPWSVGLCTARKLSGSPFLCLSVELANYIMEYAVSDKAEPAVFKDWQTVWVTY